MRLWCGGVGLWWVWVNSCGDTGDVFRGIYVDRFSGIGFKVRVLWISDIPVSYAKAIDNGYGCTSPCTQMCGAGF